MKSRSVTCLMSLIVTIGAALALAAGPVRADIYPPCIYQFYNLPQDQRYTLDAFRQCLIDKGEECTGIISSWIRNPASGLCDLESAIESSSELRNNGYNDKFLLCAEPSYIEVTVGDQREWHSWGWDEDTSSCTGVIDGKALSYYFKPGTQIPAFVMHGDNNPTTTTVFVAMMCGNYGGVANATCRFNTTMRVEKFDDANMNGVREPDELSVPWTVYYSGPETGSGTTPLDASVLPGDYTVTEDTATQGWMPTTPTSVFGVHATVCNPPTVTFGNVRTGSITVTKFDDANDNGHQDAGERGVANWPICLTGTWVNGTAQDKLCQNTGSDGTTTFTGLPPGTYTVSENVTFSGDPPIAVVNDYRWFATTATSQTVTLAEGATGTAAFGNIQVGSIAGIKWDDTNCNHSQDPGEASLPDWQITLTGNDIGGHAVSRGPIATGPDGRYEFPDLLPSDTNGYSVSETIADPLHWGPTTPAPVAPGALLPDPVPPVPNVVALTEGEDRSGVDFGNVQLGSICGFKFYDADATLPPEAPTNGDGMWEPNEPKLSDWTFRLAGAANPDWSVSVPATVDLDMDLVQRETTTDENGSFCFPRLYPTHVPPGYTVWEVPPSPNGWFLTSPQVNERSTLLDEAEEIVPPDQFEYGNLRRVPGGLTIGFWKTHPQAITAAMYAGLSSQPAFKGVNSWAKLYPILSGAKAVDMTVMLRAQLAGMTLNVLSGRVDGGQWIYVGDIPLAPPLFGGNITTVQHVLDVIEAAYPWRGWSRSQQEAAKDALDNGNNDLSLVSPTP